MKLAVIICALAALLLSGAAQGAVALDTTACPSSVCPSASQSAGTATTLTTASFSTSASVVLVACTAWAAGGGSAGVTNSITVSGAGLTWTKNIEAITNTASAPEASCWSASSTGALSAVTVSDTSGGAGSIVNLTTTFIVYVFTGASTTLGNTGFQNVGGSFTNINVTVTATGSGSFLVGAFVDTFNGSGLTAMANTTRDSNITGVGGVEMAVMRLTALTSASGAVIYGSSNNQAFMASVGIEVLPAGGAAAVTPMRSLMGVGL